MPALLLEREATLAALSRAVTGAAAGQGSVAVVTGEAGIGKTSLIRAFAREAGEHARILLSACDDLMAPRTLGPLRDAALGRDGPLAAALADDEPVEDVFTALLEELAAEPPTVLVVEDLHWADDATLDVLAYAARRVEAAGALLVLTYRDDEVDPGHPLQRLLGVLASCPVHRLELTALSREAVRRLSAGTGADPEAVHRITRGNPFFVTEALASPRDAVPASVVEAVLARVGRLGDDCRQALDQLSVVPSHVSLDARRRAAGTADRRAGGGRAGRRDRRPAGQPRVPARARPPGDRAQPPGAAAAQPQRRRGGGAARASAPRARARDAPCRRGERRRDDPRRRAERGAGGRARRFAPAGARALRVDAPAPAPGAGARARRPARRLRMGALQRASLPRRRRGRPRGGGAVRAARGAGRARRVPRPDLPAPVHGRRDRRGRAVRQPRAGDPRAGRRRGGAGPRLALHGRDPRAHRRPGARASGCSSVRATWPGSRDGRTCRRSRSTTSASRAPSSATRAGWRCSAGASRWRSPRAGTSTPRAATATSPRCSGAAAGSTSSSAGRGRGPALRARARLLVARVQPRGPSLRACSCAAGDSARRSRGLRELVEGGRRPRDALRLQRAVARPPARAPRRPRGGRRCSRRRGSARRRQRLLLGLAYAGLARGRVGVAGRRAGGRPRAWPASCCRAPRIPAAAPFRGELLRYLARAGLPAEPFEGCPRAVGGGPARRLARGRRGLGGGRRPVRAGARARRVGRAGADRRGPAHPRRGSAPTAAAAGRASACGRWARASRGARGRRRGRTPRA